MEWQQRYKVITFNGEHPNAKYLLVDLDTCLTMWDAIYPTREIAEIAAVNKVFENNFKEILTINT
jgi:hypothetical protein